jgi:hypothetical protein
VLWIVTSARGGEQFPSPLEYIDGPELSVFALVLWTVSSARGMGTVPFACGIHQRTRTVGISISVLYSE